MLPKAVLEIIKNRHVFSDDECLSFDPMSIAQINHYFRVMINRLYLESKIYDKLFRNRYYVVLGLDVDEIEFIKGDYFLDFSITIPDLYTLKKSVLKQGIPPEDVTATSFEVENLFRGYLLNSQARFRRYTRYLCGAHEPMNVTKESLIILFNKITEMKCLHEIKLEHCTVERQSRFLRVLIRELSRQLDTISIVFTLRNIS